MPAPSPAHTPPLAPAPAKTNPAARNELATCSAWTPCPVDWKSTDQGGGYFCKDNNGCRPVHAGPFPTCTHQCFVRKTSHAHTQGCSWLVHGIFLYLTSAAIMT